VSAAVPFSEQTCRSLWCSKAHTPITTRWPKDNPKDSRLRNHDCSLCRNHLRNLPSIPTVGVDDTVKVPLLMRTSGFCDFVCFVVTVENHGVSCFSFGEPK